MNYFSLCLEGLSGGGALYTTERLLEILPERRTQTFCRLVDVYYVENAIGESISLINIWNILTRLDSCDFSFGSVVNFLKDRKLFSDQMNRNRFDLILARPCWNCSTIENIGCVNSVVNQII